MYDKIDYIKLRKFCAIEDHKIFKNITKSLKEEYCNERIICKETLVN